MYHIILHIDIQMLVIRYRFRIMYREGFDLQSSFGTFLESSRFLRISYRLEPYRQDLSSAMAGRT